MIPLSCRNFSCIKVLKKTGLSRQTQPGFFEILVNIYQNPDHLRLFQMEEGKQGLHFQFFQ